MKEHWAFYESLNNNGEWRIGKAMACTCELGWDHYVESAERHNEPTILDLVVRSRPEGA